MTRRRNLILLTVGIAAAGGIGLAVYTRPVWRTATEAEVRAQIDPALLVVETPDAKALERFHRLAMAIKAIDARGASLSRPGDAGLQAFLRRETRHIDELAKILAEGSVQMPSYLLRLEKGGDVDLYATLSRFRAICSAAQYEARQGDSVSATRLLVTATRLHRRIIDSEASAGDVITSSAQAPVLASVIAKSVPMLGEAELTTLAAEVAATPDFERSFQRSIRTDFQEFMLPMVPDPVAWSQRVSPKNPLEHLSSIMQPDASDSFTLVGSYDALQTAKDVNFVYLRGYQNISVSRAKQDKAGDHLLADFDHSLPVSTAAGKEGWQRRWAEWRFRWEMSRHPNSFGRRLILYATGVGFELIGDQYFQTRLGWEAMRTLIALQRYRLRRGSVAPSLDALVNEGLLPKIPFDFMGDGPLRYAAGKRLWSVGEDGIDDGGKLPTRSRVSVSSPIPDIVWPLQ